MRPLPRILPLSGNIIGLGGPAHADDHHPRQTHPARQHPACRRQKQHPAAAGGDAALRRPLPPAGRPASGRRGHQPGAAGRCRGPGAALRGGPLHPSRGPSLRRHPGASGRGHAQLGILSRAAALPRRLCAPAAARGLPPRPAARGHPPGRAGRHGGRGRIGGHCRHAAAHGAAAWGGFYTAAAQRRGHNDPADGRLLRRGADRAARRCAGAGDRRHDRVSVCLRGGYSGRGHAGADRAGRQTAGRSLSPPAAGPHRRRDLRRRTGVRGRTDRNCGLRPSQL